MWRSLIVQTGESVVNLIAVERKFFLIIIIYFIILLFIFVVSYSHSVVLYLKQNKRATWHSLICAKRKNLWQN